MGGETESLANFLGLLSSLKKDLRPIKEGQSSRPAVSNLFGTRNRFHGSQFFHGSGWGVGFGMIQEHYI